MTRIPIGAIVIGSATCSIALALTLTLAVFGGARENVITGAALLAIAAGWMLLAVASTQCTDQPQRWAAVPACVFAALGVLFLAWPGIVLADRVTWIVSAIMVMLAAWMWTHARVRLKSRTRVCIIRPFVLLLVIGAVSACMESVHERVDRVMHPMRGALVSVGAYRLHIECTGIGDTTVILIGGAGALSTGWAWVAPSLARATRVCVYDRAGRGWSDGGGGPHDGWQEADDLHALLARAHVNGPLVLVGHSFGGLYARIYAARYHAQVAGVVLLDATHPNMFTRIATYPTFYDGYRRVSALFPSLARFGIARIVYRWAVDPLPSGVRAEQLAWMSTPATARSARDEWAAAPAAMEQARAAGSLGGVPLVVVTAMKNAQVGWLDLQRELIALSNHSVLVLASNIDHAGLVGTHEGARAVQNAVRAVMRNVAADD